MTACSTSARSLPHVRGERGRDLRGAASRPSATATITTTSSGSAEELATLKKRGQPPVIDNSSRPRSIFWTALRSSSGSTRRRCRARRSTRPMRRPPPRRCATSPMPKATSKKRSAVWRNMLVEGCWRHRGVAVERTCRSDYSGAARRYDVKIHRVAWDRMFCDPHSSEPDFSDAGYLGFVIWMDFDDALAQYPDGKEALETTMNNAPSATPTTTSRSSTSGPTRSASASASARSGSGATTTGILPSSPRAAF